MRGPEVDIVLSSSVAFYLILWVGVSHCGLELNSLARLADCEPEGSSYPSLPSTRITGRRCHAWLFICSREWTWVLMFVQQQLFSPSHLSSLTCTVFYIHKGGTDKTTWVGSGDVREKWYPRWCEWKCPEELHLKTDPSAKADQFELQWLWRVWTVAGPEPNYHSSWTIFSPLNNHSLPIFISDLTFCS